MGRIPRSPRGRRTAGLSEEEAKAQQPLWGDLPVPELIGSRVKFKGVTRPIWTENKAKLIERYLYYFVMITKHGTYIDGFSGPQEADKPEMWSAKLVLESRPPWLQHFYLCELNRRGVRDLESLRDSLPPQGERDPKRSIEIHHGDFNKYAIELLGRKPIREKEATFCLLDQRTFECHWSTIEALAGYKKQGVKIELFYFLPAHWFGRAFDAVQDKSILQRWWGRADWPKLAEHSDIERANLICGRFMKELKYAHAYAWPIYTRKDGGRIKYHMIHASDHDDAPKLMRRAYERALNLPEPPEQLDLPGTS